MSEAAKKVWLNSVLETLRRGWSVSDDEFDLLYSEEVRKSSPLHWTPVMVARRAAKLLVWNQETTVLDVGCGPGKFCTVGALTTVGTFVGIEQRKHLVEEGERLCREHRVERVKLIHGNMVELDWRQFNSFYLYNPFLENIASYALIDSSVTIETSLYARYIDVVKQKISALPNGTKVATFHGFGGDLPSGYELVYSERACDDYLCLWIKGGVPKGAA